MILQGKVTKAQMAAIDYFASQLLTPQLKSHIIVTIRFIKKLPVCGFTEIDGYNSSGKPREFILEIQKNMSEEETLKTFAHELCHVKQYAYGQLNEKGTKWLSRKYDHDNIPHSQRPWEKEAFKTEERLYKQWLQMKN